MDMCMGSMENTIEIYEGRRTNYDASPEIKEFDHGFVLGLENSGSRN